MHNKCSSGGKLLHTFYFFYSISPFFPFIPPVPQTYAFSLWASMRQFPFSHEHNNKNLYPCKSSSCMLWGFLLKFKVIEFVSLWSLSICRLNERFLILLLLTLNNLTCNILRNARCLRKLFKRCPFILFSSDLHWDLMSFYYLVIQFNSLPTNVHKIRDGGRLGSFF